MGCFYGYFFTNLFNGLACHDPRTQSIRHYETGLTGLRIGAIGLALVLFL
jgi:hypothetical protein